MSTRRSTLFYGLLVAFASIMIGMVIASRLDLSPHSSAQTLATPPVNGAPLSGPVDATTFRTIAKAVSPAVVNIRTEQRTQDVQDFLGGGGNSPLDRFFNTPRDGDEPEERIVQAAGTGFIIDKSGLILTNNHVVEEASRIKVSLYGDDRDQEYDAKVVGRDELTDSALIQLTEKVDHTLTEVKFGNSDQMQAGDWVMAIGNPFGLAHTVSVGVVSGIGRGPEIEGADARGPKFIQTDAAINPGNSGGPLLNVRGEVVGINTAIFSDSRQGNIGIGFAVPINTVRDLLPQLQAGKVTRGRIGVRVTDVKREEFPSLGLKSRDGAIVASVIRESAAARAGLLAGDVVTSFDGKPVKRSDDLVQMVTATKPGSTVPARVLRLRTGEEKSVNITIDELNLDTEAGQQRPRRSQGDSAKPKVELSKGFGLDLGPVEPEQDRQLRLNGQKGAMVYKVEAGSAADRILREFDLIIRVGRKTVSSPGEAADELGKVPSKSTALVWVIRPGRGGPEETFVTMTKP